MLTSRRAVLRAMAAGVGAAAVGPVLRGQSGGGLGAVSARIQADLVKHASFGVKKSGDAGDLMTAEWVAGRLRAASYKVDVLDFEAPYLDERMVWLSADGVALKVYAQTPCATTGSQGVTAPLALMRADADAAKMAGKIALYVLPSRRWAAMGLGNTSVHGALLAAAQAGAVGVVIVTTGPSGEAAMLNAGEAPALPVPVAILAPRSSALIVEAAMAGAEATLTLDGDMTHRPSKNVIGRLERGPKWIVISTPRSGWFQCVSERGTGTSVFLELAEWAVERFPEHSIHLMNTGGHEYYFAGSHRVLDLAPPAAATDVWAHIGATLAARDAVEEAGGLRMLDTADPQRSVMATGNLTAAVAEGFAGMPELAKATPIRAGAGELSAFTDRGYQKAFAVLGVHRWFHTIEDTLERVNGGLVAPVLEGHKRVMERAVAEA